MSSNLKPVIQAFVSGADLSTHQYKAVKLGADSKTIALCGAGERAIGVLMNAPELNETAEVAVSGGAKIKVSSSVTGGNSIAIGALGIGEAPSGAEWCIGQFMEDGVTGDVVSMIIDRHNSPA